MTPEQQIDAYSERPQGPQASEDDRLIRFATGSDYQKWLASRGSN